MSNNKTIQKQRSIIRNSLDSNRQEGSLLRQKSSIRWDEKNLQANEQIKNQLSLNKLDESKGYESLIEQSTQLQDPIDYSLKSTPDSDVSFLDRYDAINSSLRVRTDSAQDIDTVQNEGLQNFNELKLQHDSMMDSLRRGRILLDSESSMDAESTYENGYQGQQLNDKYLRSISNSNPNSSLGTSRSSSQVPINELDDIENELKLQSIRDNMMQK